MTDEARELRDDFGWPELGPLTSSKSWTADLERQMERGLKRFGRHGRFSDWEVRIADLPRIESPQVSLNCAVPSSTWKTSEESAPLKETFRSLGPWKKGPFQIQDMLIDAEWQSNLKWDRVLKQAEPFSGRRVLDVGTGNGYFLYRARGEGAKVVVGLEPSAHYCAQYLALQKCFQVPGIAMLPLTSDEFAQGCQVFDTVLSMGVLYHRRSPLDHLLELKGFLRSGGQLLLETIIVDGPDGYSLLPPARYAQMRNVWFLPSVKTLVSWLERLGFRRVNCGEVVATTGNEQRSTAWTEQPSLKDFLDPNDSTLTKEGHPAPKRILISAVAP